MVAELLGQAADNREDIGGIPAAPAITAVEDAAAHLDVPDPGDISGQPSLAIRIKSS